MKRFVLIGCLVFSGTGAAAENASGQQMHDQSCTKCHDSSVYTREDRFIHDLAGLRKQVQRCNVNVGAQWFDDDVDSVVQYLNQSFYKFE